MLKEKKKHIYPLCFKPTFKPINLSLRLSAAETSVFSLATLRGVNSEKKKKTLSGKPLEWFFLHIIKYSCDKSKILSAVK